MQKTRETRPLHVQPAQMIGARHEDILWLREFLFYRIPAVASYMLRETSLVCASLRPKLTTAQWRIISILANHPSLLATEISRISMLDEVAVSRALSVLARRGFIQKQRNRQDKRAREVSLTPAGWRYYGAIMPRMREHFVLSKVRGPAEEVRIPGHLSRSPRDAKALLVAQVRPLASIRCRMSRR